MNDLPDYSFQDDAVSCASDAFSKKKNGRYLVVLPTGGGKTRCAVRIINKLFDENVLNPKSEKVLWVAHRIELIDQAKKAFDDYKQYEPDKVSHASRIEYTGIKGIKEKLENGKYPFVVIDEAHHAAAPSGDSVGHGPRPARGL